MKKRIKISVLVLVLSLFPTIFAGSACGEPGKFTVTFIGNGGTLYSGVTVQTVSSVEEIEPPTFKREGYAFVGWDSDLKEITSDLTLNAEWTPNTYEITFDANGGSVELDKKSVVFDGAVGELPIPTHENVRFLFSRWVYEEREVVISGGAVWTYPEDATLKAVWIEGYAINYELNGGSAGSGTPYEYTSGNTVSLVAPTRVGYTFIGWTGEGITQPTVDVTIGESESGNKLYTANWEAKKYSLTFDANGGSVELDKKSVVFDGAVGELPIPAHENERFLFSRWVYEEREVVISGGTVWTYPEDATLKAVWIEGYAINYELNGGSAGSGTPYEYTSGNTVSLVAPTRVGYTFIGWTGEGITQPTVDVTIAESESGNKLYTANWEAKKYSLTFDANGGSVELDKKSVVFDGAVGELPIPAHENERFLFSRWVYEEREVVISGGTVWTYPEDATLKAVWIEGYAINYELNGGSAGSGTPYEYTSGNTVSLVAPTRVGYTFIGWTGEGITQPTVDVTIAESESGNKLYTANWEAKKYSLTFDANGGDRLTVEKFVTYDSEVGELPVAYKEGFEFIGWYFGANDLKIDADYKWRIDEENVVLKAKYQKAEITYYRVDFVLTCEVDGHTVQCLYKGKDKIDSVTVAKGQTLGAKLVTPEAVNEEYRDYSFIGWYYGDKKITKDTVFSEATFNNTTVTLTVKCKLDGIWTGRY